MPKSLSFDLRSRVLAAIDGGLSCHQAAARFGSAHRARSAGGGCAGWAATDVPSRKAAIGCRGAPNSMAILPVLVDIRQLCHAQTSQGHEMAGRSSALDVSFTPTSASWLNAVEGFFSTITSRKIRRGVFKFVADLKGAIERYIKQHNKTSKPFVWTASASAIFEKLAQIPEPCV